MMLPPSGLESDAWLGHPAICPSAGKKSVPAPFDATGRRDLFDVLHQGAPAPASSDSWLGHTLINPRKGKAACTGPEERMGRPHLFPIIQQVLNIALGKLALLLAVHRHAHLAGVSPSHTPRSCRQWRTCHGTLVWSAWHVTILM
jgi:hypothetical protein